jgi:hypothetical protein
MSRQRSGKNAWTASQVQTSTYSYIFCMIQHRLQFPIKRSGTGKVIADPTPELFINRYDRRCLHDALKGRDDLIGLILHHV